MWESGMSIDKLLYFIDWRQIIRIDKIKNNDILLYQQWLHNVIIALIFFLHLSIDLGRQRFVRKLFCYKFDENYRLQCVVVIVSTGDIFK